MSGEQIRVWFFVDLLQPLFFLGLCDHALEVRRSRDLTGLTFTQGHFIQCLAFAALEKNFFAFLPLFLRLPVADFRVSIVERHRRYCGEVATHRLHVGLRGQIF